MKPEVIIYTDGSCKGNPGRGGWAARLIHVASGKTVDISGGVQQTTNNRMELQAAIEGLKKLKRPTRIKLVSDSGYLIGGFKAGWLDNWVKSGWLSSRGQPVKNKDLWEALLAVSQQHTIEWEHVKGHKGNPHNEACDTLAGNAADAMLTEAP